MLSGGSEGYAGYNNILTMNNVSKFFSKIKYVEEYIYPIFFFLLLAMVTSYFYTRSHYVDLFNFCNISVDKDFLKGNSSTVIKAIGIIKEQDKTAYKDVCRYVDLVSENYCPVYHTYGGSFEFNNQPGCYIKGSKVIYVNPQKQESKTIIEQRVEAIKKYSSLSKEYWSKKQ